MTPPPRGALGRRASPPAYYAGSLASPAVPDSRRDVQSEREALPVAIPFDPAGAARDYWLARLDQQYAERYAGVPMPKLAEDLRIYEHLLWLTAPSVVIEVGTLYGGSALWFRDRLMTLATYGRIERPRVISIDIDVAAARGEIAAAAPDWHETITLVEADATDPDLPDRIAELIPSGARVLLSEDSAHDYATTLAVLRGFAQFVQPGGFIVVEDGYVDVPALRPDGDGLPVGVLPAIEDWLSEPDGSRFHRRPDLQLYGLTAFPTGLLQRKNDAPDAVVPRARRSVQTAGVDPEAPPAGTGDAETEIAALSQIISSLRGELVEWQERARVAEQQRESWQGRALTAESQWRQDVEHLSGRIAELERRLDVVYDSASWRLTEPLRQVMRTLRSARRR